MICVLSIFSRKEQKGRIIQIGTHNELMSVKGQYRWAAKLQTADDESKRLLGVGEVGA